MAGKAELVSLLTIYMIRLATLFAVAVDAIGDKTV
jgi:hypothetical protein